MDQQIKRLEEENTILNEEIQDLKEQLEDKNAMINYLQVTLQEISEQNIKQQDNHEKQQQKLQQYQGHLKQLLQRVSWQVTTESVSELTQSFIQRVVGQSISQIGNMSFLQPHKDQIASENAVDQEIFEAFYMFGIDKIDSTNQSQYLLPSNYKIQYQQYKQRFLDQPNNEEFKKFKEVEVDLEQFIHPSGIEAQRLYDENIDFEISKILQQKIKFENFYVINIKGDDLQLKIPKNIRILQSFNHERQLYGYCAAIDDFLCETDNIGQTIFWKVKKVLCFLSYFPIKNVFYELFEQILCNYYYIVSYNKIEAIIYDEHEGQYDKANRWSINSKSNDKILSKDTAQLLNMIIGKLSRYSIKNYGDEIDIHFKTLVEGLVPKDFIEELKVKFEMQVTFEISKYIYKVPDQNSLYFEIKKQETHIVLKLFKIQQFFTIFEEILKEGKIVFCCQNQHLLTAVVSFFYTILKPYKWFHQAIFNLKIESVTYEQFDVPILIGINMPYSNLKFNQKIILINKMHKVLWVDINENLQKVNIIDYKGKIQHQCWNSQKQYLAQYFPENNKIIGGFTAFTPNSQDEERIRGFLKEFELFIRDYLMKIIAPKKEGFVQGTKLNNFMIYDKIKENIAKEITDEKDREFINQYVLHSDYFKEYLKHIYIR